MAPVFPETAYHFTLRPAAVPLAGREHSTGSTERGRRSTELIKQEITVPTGAQSATCAETGSVSAAGVTGGAWESHSCLSRYQKAELK